MSAAPAPALLDPARVGDLDATGVLRAAREMRRTEHAAAAATLALACAWADQHPALEPGDEATFVERGPAGGVHLPIAGEGCPAVAEFAVAELGAVLGESTVAAKRLIGHALELRHRLPRLWALVQDGQVPAWRARSVAAESISAGLTREAAAWVDSQVSAVAGRVGSAAVQRLVEAAIVRFGLTPGAEQPPDQRRVDLDDHDPTTGTSTLTAVVSTADGLDLDRALSHGAATLAALGSCEPLDVRRSRALGDLARHETALDLHAQEHDQAREVCDDTRLPTARELVLTLHFDAALDGGQLQVGPLGRLDQSQRLVLRDHVRGWCADSHTRVTVRPVVDLRETLASPGYAIPQRIRDHVMTRDRTCMFPWCTQPASRCDLDHVTPYDHAADRESRSQPGPTSTDNLIATCRRHHRLKTHTAWQVEMPAPGTVTWTSPHGHRFHRDRHGTTALRD